MTRYEMYLLGGTAMLTLAIMMFFTAASRDRPVQKSIAVFLLGGVLIYLADQNAPHGINPGDIPDALYQFVLPFF